MQKIESKTSGVTYKQYVIMYNDFCFYNKCKHYRTWNPDFAGCVSCDKLEDTYDITRYPNDCIFLAEIKIFKQEQEKRIAWEMLSDEE